MSICTISVLAPDFLTLPGWLCVPAKSIHLSLPQCAKPAQRENEDKNTLQEKLCQVEKSGESGGNVKTWGERMQGKEQNHTFSGPLQTTVICLTISSG